MRPSAYSVRTIVLGLCGSLVLHALCILLLRGITVLPNVGLELALPNEMQFGVLDGTTEPARGPGRDTTARARHPSATDAPQPKADKPARPAKPAVACERTSQNRSGARAGWRRALELRSERRATRAATRSRPRARDCTLDGRGCTAGDAAGRSLVAGRFGGEPTARPVAPVSGIARLATFPCRDGRSVPRR